MPPCCSSRRQIRSRCFVRRFFSMTSSSFLAHIRYSLSLVIGVLSSRIGFGGILTRPSPVILRGKRLVSPSSCPLTSRSGTLPSRFGTRKKFLNRASALTKGPSDSCPNTSLHCLHTPTRKTSLHPSAALMTCSSEGVPVSEPQ